MKMRMILLLMRVDAPCVYTLCFRMHADHRKKGYVAAVCQVAVDPAALRGSSFQAKRSGRLLNMPRDLKNLLNSWK